MQLDLFMEETPEVNKDKRTMLCYKCGIVHPVSEFSASAVKYEFEERPMGSAGVTGTARYCKSCRSSWSAGLQKAHKQAPPKPKTCDCCGKETEPSKLNVDHDHDTGDFRGWLCRRCNLGLGQLGDNIEGLNMAIAYLMKAQDERD